MKITAVDVRCCQHSPGNFDSSAFRTGDFGNFEFIAVTMKTDTGLEATTFGFAGRSARGAGRARRSQQSRGVRQSIGPAVAGLGPATANPLTRAVRSIFTDSYKWSQAGVLELV